MVSASVRRVAFFLYPRCEAETVSGQVVAHFVFVVAVECRNIPNADTGDIKSAVYNLTAC